MTILHFNIDDISYAVNVANILYIEKKENIVTIYIQGGKMIKIPMNSVEGTNKVFDDIVEQMGEV